MHELDAPSAAHYRALDERIRLLEKDNELVGTGFQIFLLGVITSVVLALLLGSLWFAPRVP